MASARAHVESSSDHTQRREWLQTRRSHSQGQRQHGHQTSLTLTLLFLHWEHPRRLLAWDLRIGIADRRGRQGRRQTGWRAVAANFRGLALYARRWRIREDTKVWSEVSSATRWPANLDCYLSHTTSLVYLGTLSETCPGEGGWRLRIMVRGIVEAMRRVVEHGDRGSHQAFV